MTLAHVLLNGNHLQTMPHNDAATRWNREHPIGTRVVVKLANGKSTQDCTASGAVPWGSIALVTLRDRPGMWTTDMLDALPGQAPSDSLR